METQTRTQKLSLLWRSSAVVFVAILLLGIIQIVRFERYLGHNGEQQRQKKRAYAAKTAARPIAVFYNVYADPDDIVNAQDIVIEQMQHVRPEHRVLVRSIGAQFPIENATRIRHDQEGSEIETLGLLWDNCRDSPHAENDTVVYIHTKGSFHPSDENTMLRRWITPAALSRECSQMPPFCNICSFRFSPHPHPHSPGNMWAARCSYIKLLLDPLKFEQKMEQFYIINKMKESPPEIGTGRFAAEHWVHSHPALKACDLSTR
jgi:hypothetical protein